MSFFAGQIPRRLSMWVLGKSLGAAMDVTPLIRAGVIGLGTILVGSLLAVIALIGLLGALYMYLTTGLLLSAPVSLLIVSALCAAVATGAFFYMRNVVLPIPRNHFSRIHRIIRSSLEGGGGHLFHSSGDIIRNFADGFMRK